MSDIKLRIMIIDDNPAIHQDFIKVLSSYHLDSNLSKLDSLLFEETFDESLSDDTSLLPEFALETVSQGQEGLEKIKAAMSVNAPFALVFVDIRMPPGWDGIKTIQEIWKVDPDIQVVICTAFSDYTWAETVRQLGQGDNYLILRKPFDSIAVRQLACALTKKWLLAREAKVYTEALGQEVVDKTKSLEESLQLLRATTDKLAFQATHDLLTNMPNRVLLLDRMQQCIDKGLRYGSRFGIIFLDLDRFKLVNDSLSHNAGDQLLQLVAKRLGKLIRKEDTLARIGGDEFVMIVENVNSETDMMQVANKIMEQLKQPFMLGHRSLTVTASLGISLFPANGKTVSQLLKRADLAMYQAKDLGGNLFKFYSKEMNIKAQQQFILETALVQACERDEFKMVYQPQFDLVSGRLLTLEALIRWHHPKKGLLYPQDFISVAESTNLIVLVGEWVIKNVCQQMRKWLDRGMAPICVGVNVAMKQLQQQDFAEMVKRYLEEYKITPENLELEISENVVIKRPDILNMMQQLKDIGVKIVLDDFGAGNSSINYLKKIEIDSLKIDQSFIKNLSSSRNDKVIIEAIIAMAHSFNFKVVGEGVETADQMHFLKQSHCDEVQGFLFGKPLSSDEVEAWINQI